jgi:hypothetical protein
MVQSAMSKVGEMLCLKALLSVVCQNHILDHRPVALADVNRIVSLVTDRRRKRHVFRLQAHRFAPTPPGRPPERIQREIRFGPEADNETRAGTIEPVGGLKRTVSPSSPTNSPRLRKEDKSPLSLSSKSFMAEM